MLTGRRRPRTPRRALVGGQTSATHAYRGSMERPEPEQRRQEAAAALALDDEALLRACEVSTFVGGGPGGQHRNKTASAVRLVHLPTGVTVTATERRSQAQNRGTALERLAGGPARADQRAAPPSSDPAVARGQGAPPRREETARPEEGRPPRRRWLVTARLGR